MTRPAAQDLTCTPTWDRRATQLVDHSAYLLLAIGFALVMAQPQSQQDRIVAILLSLVALAWITVYIRVPAFRGGRRGPTLVYFFGLLTVASVLMLHHPLFFPVMIAGFFHVYMLRPWPLTLLGVGTTSFLINTLLADPFPSTARDILFWATVIVVQTLAITGGVIVGQKGEDLSEERRQMVTELQAALDENAGLHRQLMIQAREAGILDERQRLAREIHDTLAQGLTGIIRQLEVATRGDASEQRRYIDTAMGLARESLSDARRSVLALGPESLDNARLPEALAQVGQRWSQTSGVTADVTTTGTGRRLHPTIEVTLLRVAQEALANVARHAHASRAGVTLSYTDDVVMLDVRDDGVGFTPPPVGARNGTGGNGGFGLTAMRQRLGQVGGTLSIESGQGAGTSISASVPALPPGSQTDDRGTADA